MSILALERRQALLLAAAVFVVLVGAGVVATHGSGSAGGPHRAAALRPQRVADTAVQRGLVVHVVGAVRRPGLYRFRDGARIADAVRRAGGATRRADLEAVNLAAPLADGTQVVVPRKVAATVAAGGDAPASPAGPVHLNTATAEELDALPGVGPVTAEKIIDYRQKHGAFVSVDDLDSIPGIGPARLEQLRELVAP